MRLPRELATRCGFLTTLLVAELTIAVPGAQADTSQTPLGQPTVPMKVAVIDARTLKDIRSGRVYRLFAIDVCALDQVTALDGQPLPCGIMATAWIVQ